MNKHIHIADAELPIMKVLWEQDNLTSPEIFAGLEGNRNTQKTLLKRLVSKGAVRAEEINSRTFRYSALVTREEYIRQERGSFLNKVFDGSAAKMMLNFVQEEKISREELQELLDMIEKE